MILTQSTKPFTPLGFASSNNDHEPYNYCKEQPKDTAEAEPCRTLGLNTLDAFVCRITMIATLGVLLCEHKAGLDLREETLVRW
jgi:hypothetical protein